MIYFLSGEGDKLERLINALTRIQVTLIFYHIDSEEQKIMMGSKKTNAFRSRMHCIHAAQKKHKHQSFHRFRDFVYDSQYTLLNSLGLFLSSCSGRHRPS